MAGVELYKPRAAAWGKGIWPENRSSLQVAECGYRQCCYISPVGEYCGCLVSVKDGDRFPPAITGGRHNKSLKLTPGLT